MSAEQSEASDQDGLGREGPTRPENVETQFPRARSDRVRLTRRGHRSLSSAPAVGHGGMGEVWLAEQKQPVRRRVAIKLIKAGMDTREVVARFESERQALALMDHPAIAKVFDAGSTPQGRPYFVMEYVTGIPITAYCDKHKLTMRQRLELFMRVCEGVQHAHQKAILHRDLKPSNILVGEVDGKPAPRIIDFGVAKATAQRLTADTMFTRVGAIVGTPGYMSPEQADSAGADVDTRTDVYSLGVVLYELLVGALPLDFSKTTPDQVPRRLRDEDAPAPQHQAAHAGRAVRESRPKTAAPMLPRWRGNCAAIWTRSRSKLWKRIARGGMPRPPNWPPTSEDICAMSRCWRVRRARISGAQIRSPTSRGRGGCRRRGRAADLGGRGTGLRVAAHPGASAIARIA